MPDVLEVAAAAEKPFCINLGGGAASTNLVCGYLACDAQPFNPLLESLPPVINVGNPAHDGAGWISQFIRFAVSEATEKHAGSESVLTKLSELLFIDVVRRYLVTLPPEHTGWLAGLRDPLIAKVMFLMHARPTHDWGIDELAREAGTSRSVLAERFAKLIGTPPMHYLAKWRMQIASQLLRSGQTNLATIAADVGYESGASFSRAFKKAIGVSPSVWRRGQRPDE
jgi:AraC-like DNA-binding protein